MIKNTIFPKIYNILFLILFFLIIQPAFGQRLKGKIISFRETYYSVIEKFGKIKKGPRLENSIFHDQYVSFDQNGNVIEAIEYNSDGTIYCKYKGRNDYKDNNIESIYVRFYPEKSIDKKPFILESASYSLGKICEMSCENDAEGLPIEETISDNMGRVLYKISIKRDEKGNSLEDIISDGVINQYKYDNKENRIEWISRSSSGSTTVTSFKYDDFGNIIEMNSDNFFKSTYKFHYDKYTYEYRFDKEGNWIERIDVSLRP